jgi:hypothetical protein
MFGELFTMLLKVGHGNYMFMLGLFIVFVYTATKAIKTVIRGVYVAVASAIFPVFLNMIGMEIPLNLGVIISFVIMGMGLYFVYVLGKGVFHVLSLGEKIVSPFGMRFRQRREEDKIRKYVEDYREEKKKKD